MPVATPRRRQDRDRTPVGFIHPIIDGRCTEFYEWHGAARVGSARAEARCTATPGSRATSTSGSISSGSICEWILAGVDPPGADVTLAIDVLAPKPARLLVTGLIPAFDR